jgi:hypothetical protein
MLGVDPDSKGERHVPELRILAGNPTAEELAAVTVVLLGCRGAAEAAAPPASSRWRADARWAPTVRPGRGAWRAAALP